MWWWRVIDVSYRRLGERDTVERCMYLKADHICVTRAALRDRRRQRGCYDLSMSGVSLTAEYSYVIRSMCGAVDAAPDYFRENERKE